MTRARRAAAAVLVAALCFPAAARATPFADVPADHWDYQAIQRLAADGLVDGYPDGAFKGDRPLSRYEMAAIVARILTKIEIEGATSASKADLDTLQKLTNALADELAGLGVRVTALEDELAALDRRTSFAQSLTVHGALAGEGLSRQRLTNPQAVDGSGISDFVNAFETSSASNNPIDQQNGPETLLRTNDRLTIDYRIDPNLTVSLPIRIYNYDLNGEFATTSQVQVQPDLVVSVAQAGALTNLTFRDGELDDLRSSLTGLTYRAPTPLDVDPNGFATQPYGHGFALGATVGGATDVQFTLQQDDQTLIDTQPYVVPANGSFGTPGYFTYVQPAQVGAVQVGPPGSTSGALATDTFAAGAAPLGGVFLRRKAVAGTVYISAFATGAGSELYDNAGAIVGGSGIPGVGSAPPFAYLDQTNEVVFLSPLPAGSTVTITYVGLGAANQLYQRYEAGLRVEHRITGVPGATIGFTAHRLWDESGPVTTSDQSAYYAGLTSALPGTGYGPVTDTVFGLDAQAPIAFARAGAHAPVLFAEVATSRYTPDTLVVAPVSDEAGIAGLRFTIGRMQARAELQSVGPNYLDGAPFRYFGDAPATWSNYQGAAFPQFFGFVSTLAIDRAYDASVNAIAPGRSSTASSAALTQLYPVFTPFVASGPNFYSAFAPNTQGPTLVIDGPMTIAGLALTAHLSAQHLTEVQPDANATSTFGPQFATTVRASWDQIVGSASTVVRLFGKRATLDVDGTYEHLARGDRTGQLYVPYNAALGAYDPASLASFVAAGGRVSASNQLLSAGAVDVTYDPNYIDATHTELGGGLAWPVARDLTLSAHISDQHYAGSYGLTTENDIGGTKDQLDLDLTYDVPNTNSSLGLGYRVSSYKDVSLPSYDFVQTQENVNVRFHF